MSLADALNISEAWESLGIGRPTGRVTAYRGADRIRAILMGLACGLPGIAPGNDTLRPSSAMSRWLGGRFPDQGTIPRWLQAATIEQAEAVRTHLHESVLQHGRFRQHRFSAQELIVDVDGQSLVARGKGFERTALGDCDGKYEPSSQRFSCDVPQTREVIDELLRPGNEAPATVFPDMLTALCDLFEPDDRGRVILRGDVQFGTIPLIHEVQQAGFGYVFKMHTSTVKRLVKDLAGTEPKSFADPQTGQTVDVWQIDKLKLERHREGPVQTITTPAVLFREQECAGDDERPKSRYWGLLVQTEKTGCELRQCYRDRGGAIEEFFDQTETGYHLEIKRTASFAGLWIVHQLAALCWNLTTWGTEDLRLPPPYQPDAAPEDWVPAHAYSLPQLHHRASHSGVLLYCPDHQLEASSPSTPEALSGSAGSTAQSNTASLSQADCEKPRRNRWAIPGSSPPGLFWTYDLNDHTQRPGSSLPESDFEGRQRLERRIYFLTRTH
jgi:hypothetical protein